MSRNQENYFVVLIYYENTQVIISRVFSYIAICSSNSKKIQSDNIEKYRIKCYNTAKCKEKSPHLQNK